MKHLPFAAWPACDRNALEAAFWPGDPFDGGAGSGSHLSPPTRVWIQSSYGRWLGFLEAHDGDAINLAPADRITAQRVQAYVGHLSARVRLSSVATYVEGLLRIGRLIAPDQDWRWLRRVKSRIAARIVPEDRFHRLVPPWETLDLGIRLMDEADRLKKRDYRAREIQFRDGLLIALLSVWPIRRRSLASITVAGHVARSGDSVTLLLHERDTKSRRCSAYQVPERLLPYVTQYLDQVRPRLMGARVTDSFWISYQGGTLSADGIYVTVRKRIVTAFHREMGLHDFRRAATTFIAMEAPEAVGLIPSVLQHASPEVSQRHYNLARSSAASRRFTSLIVQRRRAAKQVRREKRER